MTFLNQRQHHEQHYKIFEQKIQLTPHFEHVFNIYVKRTFVSETDKVDYVYFFYSYNHTDTG